MRSMLTPWQRAVAEVPKSLGVACGGDLPVGQVDVQGEIEERLPSGGVNRGQGDHQPDGQRPYKQIRAAGLTAASCQYMPRKALTSGPATWAP
jgi:hypothetical protein